MSQRTTKSRHLGTSPLRARAAVLAAGLGISTLMGAGVAAAADSQASVALPDTTATSVKAQADAQAKAAASAKQAAAKQAAAKQAAAKKAAAKKAVKPSWVDPVAKYKLSASFAQAGNMWSHNHSGQDFAVASGTKVVATHGGTVVKAGGNGAGDGPAYGNAVVIKHGNGTYSQYAHLSRINVNVGQVVATGQTIALSGNTGNSSGPHLHFEIRTTPNYGSAVDPVKFLRSKGVTV
ncbi:M23 family metallopeptidase [Streptomyces sporangiiformans]|uniref:M23 family metallopeptidase n=1 Tax=Streptomyces sporangiiformans TaxID=2315329 RepID=A0A505DEA0_9ACTN|nr:M23 family metallopeptidase [Streptomyces sporangiiformans]TPQ20812.1 M23 family metallopeptidase [Streptomyces sporangiiformans]